MEDAAEFVNSAILVPRDELQDYVGDVMLEDDLEGFKVIDRLEGEIGTLEFIDDTQNFVTYKFKPNLRTLGQRYGKYIPQIKEGRFTPLCRKGLFP